MIFFPFISDHLFSFFSGYSVFSASCLYFRFELQTGLELDWYWYWEWSRPLVLYTSYISYINISAKILYFLYRYILFPIKTINSSQCSFYVLKCKSTIIRLIFGFQVANVKFIYSEKANIFCKSTT